MADIEKLNLSMAGERCDDAVLPCPFCGSKNIAYGKYEHTAGGRYAIVCMNCMAQIDPGWAQSWGAVQEMWNRRAKPANEPLTLDELRGMEERGESIYVCKTDGTPIFRGNLFTAAVLDTTQAFGTLNGLHLQAIYGRRLTLAEGDYGETWLAYRRKPEGSETDAKV